MLLFQVISINLCRLSYLTVFKDLIISNFPYVPDNMGKITFLNFMRESPKMIIRIREDLGHWEDSQRC